MNFENFNEEAEYEGKNIIPEKSAIKEALEAVEEKSNDATIPPQYEGMPSEIVEEIWSNKIYLDLEKNKTESKKRSDAIEKIRIDELNQQKEKSNNFKKLYSELSEIQRIEYLNNQKKVENIVIEYIQDRATIEGLSLSESFVLNKIKESYREFKKDNQDKPFSFEFGRDIDRAIYNNLFYRLSFEELETDQSGDTKDNNSKKTNLGLGTGNAHTELNISPEEKDKDASGLDLKKMYEDIANKIPIDEKQLPSKDMFSLSYGNAFGENDSQSLAGKVIMKEIYDNLVNRLDYESKLTPKEIIQLGEKDFEDFKKYIEQLNGQGGDTGDDFRFDIDRPGGSTGFHLNGEAGHVSRTHLFYFSKTSSEWKDPQEQQVRAYITIHPKERENIQRHFVDLCKKLYDEGIDFSGKAASPNGLEKRTDNMVLYISLSDQARAGELIKDFLDNRGIGCGHVSAAIPSPENGLSWALEPSEKDMKIWQEVSGSSEQGSYNAVVAAKVAPIFLRRISERYQKLGNQDEADAFTNEVERIEKIIKE